jgi:hypothetical protein
MKGVERSDGPAVQSLIPSLRLISISSPQLLNIVLVNKNEIDIVLTWTLYTQQLHLTWKERRLSLSDDILSDLPNALRLTTYYLDSSL